MGSVSARDDFYEGGLSTRTNDFAFAGIVRFKTKQAVEFALNKFRSEEIVVQDVAVQVKVLRPGNSGISGSADDDVQMAPASQT